MLYLPEGLPAISALVSEGAAVAGYDLHRAAVPGDAFPADTHRILLLNLMPQKAVTELDVARMMAAAPVDVALLPMKIAGQSYKTTPMSHMDAYYRDFEDYAAGSYDGLIITGAPVEHLPFEDVRYWSQLCAIMYWADSHVGSTLYVCWGAQAGLNHHYGIAKHALPAKMFGIFAQHVEVPASPLAAGLPPTFPMPHSRHTAVERADVERAGLTVVAAGEESGVGIAATADGRRVFVVGHLEYEPFTLHNEYRRDLAKGLPIAPPRHYYEGDDPAAAVRFSWGTAARRFYANWVELCRRNTVSAHAS